MKRTKLNKPKKLSSKDSETSRPTRNIPDLLKPKRRKDLMKWLIEKKDRDNSWI